MEEIVEIMEQQPKEVLQYIILLLMKSGHLSYEDITTVYVEYLDNLRKGATDNYMTLQSKIMNMWCDKKLAKAMEKWRENNIQKELDDEKNHIHSGCGTDADGLQDEGDGGDSD